MVKRTGPTNPMLSSLVDNMKRASVKQKAPIWKYTAEKLGKATRSRVEVNLSRINRSAEEGKVILVPGVVLASGEISKPVSVAAWKFSANASEKIRKAKGKTLTIEELIKENPKGTGIKVMV